MKKLKAVSLFSSGGIGDIALNKCGIDTIVANELVEERAKVFEYNHRKTKMIVGNIWDKKNEIILTTRKILEENSLDIIFATPPCQGMSKNGRGKLLNGIRKGIKPKLDVRNQLIIPTLEIIKELQPTTVVFENVPEMKDTIVECNKGKLVNLIDLITESLVGYTGQAEVVEFADYGVPQKRQRLITVFTKNKDLVSYYDKNTSFLPPRTHSSKGDEFKRKWKTVREAIGHLPSIDASTKEKAVFDGIPYHRVPVLDKEKYFWVSNTPYGKSAFNNQCVNSKCLFSMNQTHGASKDKDGINRTHKTTPIRCIKCNELLPRPWVKDGNEYRLMKGYTSSYKRMEWDSPASALTRNLSYACSDNKLHPSQNRVLSLYEAFVIHTINEYDYKWSRIDGKKVSDKCIRDIIGESIPPLGLGVIFNHLVNFKTRCLVDPNS